MSTIAYARVSTAGQNIDGQLDILKSHNPDKLFQEVASGSGVARPVWDECQRYLRSGDTLLVTRLDRLARSTLDLCQIAETLDKEGVHLQVTEQAIDTSTPEGRFLFQSLAAVAEFEKAIRAERQREGIAKAKAAGKYANCGRKATPAETMDAIRQSYQVGGSSYRKLARKYGVSLGIVAKACAGVSPPS